MNARDKTDKKCCVWCIKAHSRPVKVNAHGTKKHEKILDTIKTTGINLENGINFKS